MEVDKDRLKIKGMAAVVLDTLMLDTGNNVLTPDPRDIQETRGLEERAYV